MFLNKKIKELILFKLIYLAHEKYINYSKEQIESNI